MENCYVQYITLYTHLKILKSSYFIYIGLSLQSLNSLYKLKPCSGYSQRRGSTFRPTTKTCDYFRQGADCCSSPADERQTSSRVTTGNPPRAHCCHFRCYINTALPEQFVDAVRYKRPAQRTMDRRVLTEEELKAL